MRKQAHNIACLILLTVAGALFAYGIGQLIANSKEHNAITIEIPEVRIEK